MLCRLINSRINKLKICLHSSFITLLFWFHLSCLMTEMTSFYPNLRKTFFRSFLVIWREQWFEYLILLVNLQSFQNQIKCLNLNKNLWFYFMNTVILLKLWLSIGHNKIQQSMKLFWKVKYNIIKIKWYRWNNWFFPD